MFHYDQRHVMAEQERREQEIARLQRRRQVEALLESGPKFYHRLLAYVGRKLVNLGCQLQTPYNRMVAPPPIIASRPSEPQLRLNC